MVLPTDFEIYTRQLMGESLYAQFADALDSEAPASIRLNPFKTATAAPANGADKVPWCRYGYYLSGRPAFTFDPLLHAGAYYGGIDVRRPCSEAGGRRRQSIGSP